MPVFNILLFTAVHDCCCLFPNAKNELLWDVVWTVGWWQHVDLTRVVCVFLFDTMNDTWNNDICLLRSLEVFSSHFYRVEKYRPQSLDELISHKDILSTSKTSSMWAYRACLLCKFGFSLFSRVNQSAHSTLDCVMNSQLEFDWVACKPHLK